MRNALLPLAICISIAPALLSPPVQRYVPSLATPARAQSPQLLAQDQKVQALIRAGRFQDALPEAELAVRLAESELGIRSTAWVIEMDLLGLVLTELSEFDEAEQTLKRALEVQDSMDPNSAVTEWILDNLASLYGSYGIYEGTDKLYLRALAILQRLPGSNDRSFANIYNNLGIIYMFTDRHQEAQENLWRAIEIRQRSLPPDDPDVAESLENLALLYSEDGRADEAEDLFKKVLAIKQGALASDHPEIARTLLNLCDLYTSQHRYREADPLCTKGLEIRQRALGDHHPYVGDALHRLALVEMRMGLWAPAYDHLKRAADIRLTREVNAAPGERKFGGGEGRNRNIFFDLVSGAWGLAQAEPGRRDALAAEAFEAAQTAERSAAGLSLAQMAMRGGGNGSLIRESQDLEHQREAADAQLTAVLALPVEQRGGADIRARAALRGIDARLQDIGVQLRGLPKYSVLFEALPLADAAKQLRENEVLVKFLFSEDEAFVWVVSPQGTARWARIALTGDQFGEYVQVLRCGLDRDGEWPWSNGRQRRLARKKTCNDLKPDGLAKDEFPPFDVTRAHELYKALFGEVEDAIKGKHLIEVPSGGLAVLPLGVLVTQPPERSLAGVEIYRSAKWLETQQDITVLPSVGSLKALRALAKPSKADRSFVGFGDPLLEGNPRDSTDRSRAKEARNKQACQPDQRVVDEAAMPVQPGGRSDIAGIESLSPLPETADQVCAIAAALGAQDDRDVHLGAAATKERLQEMSDHHELDKYSVVLFATHGLLAAETAERTGGIETEPALVFTPPPRRVAGATRPLDNGLLTASEVSTLKLDADWVVLSACNTAAAIDDAEGEALSGLASAFFYAGARAVLVSHWYADAEATKKLIITMFDELKKNANLRRSEALALSIKALLADRSQDNAAHPAAWAPFVVVGESIRAGP
jgi:CHAT domain-containing protein/tetratricopeptide (TPR) repeat protein